MSSQQQQGCLCIDNGNDVIVMRVTIAVATMAKMPVHQQQQCHHDKDDNASMTTSNEGDKASLSTAEMPAH